MPQDTFNLKDVDIVLLQLKDEATALQLRLMTLIRDLYRSDEEIESKPSISIKKFCPNSTPGIFAPRRKKSGHSTSCAKSSTSC